MLPPLVERELRIALLRRGARGQWQAAAWTAGAITLLFLLVLGAGSVRSMGRTLFHWLFVLGCAGVVTRGFGLTADLLSEERRNGTLGLLVLTGLHPTEIFLNKLLGAALLTFYGLLGGLPFFAISFLVGGVQPTEFVCALIFLANGLLFCTAVGLLASVLHREGGQAQIMTLAMATTLALATPVAHWVAALAFTSGMSGHGWLVLSPAYAPYLVFTSFITGSPQLFWITSGITLGYSMTALLLAAVILHRTWRDGPETLAPSSWRERWQTWLRDSKTSRWRLRAKLLDDDPFCWLAARDRRPLFLAKLFLAIVTALWLGGWAIGRGAWLGIGNAFVSSIVLHLGLNGIVAYAAAKRLGEERQSGGFEILLTTPLAAEEIIESQRKALAFQFRQAVVATLLLDLAFFSGAIYGRGWSFFGTVTYWATCAALLLLWFAVHNESAFRAMWIGTWTGRPGYAALHAMRPAAWLFVIFLLISSGTLRAFPRGWALQLVFVCVLFLLGTLANFGGRRVLREKLIGELRQIACAPIPSRGDKRFRNWEPRNIVPPGRWGELELRESRGQRAWTVSSGLKRTWSRHAELLPSRRRDKRF